MSDSVVFVIPAIKQVYLPYLDVERGTFVTALGKRQLPKVSDNFVSQSICVNDLNKTHGRVHQKLTFCRGWYGHRVDKSYANELSFKLKVDLKRNIRVFKVFPSFRRYLTGFNSSD